MKNKKSLNIIITIGIIIGLSIFAVTIIFVFYWNYFDLTIPESFKVISCQLYIIDYLMLGIFIVSYLLIYKIIILLDDICEKLEIEVSKIHSPGILKYWKVKNKFISEEAKKNKLTFFAFVTCFFLLTIPDLFKLDFESYIVPYSFNQIDYHITIIYLMILVLGFIILDSLYTIMKVTKLILSKLKNQ